MILLRHPHGGEIPSGNTSGFLTGVGANGVQWAETALPRDRETQNNLIALAATPDISGIYIHGIESRADMEMCGMLMAVGEAEAGIEEATLGLIAVLETSAAILNIHDIAKGHPRLRGLAVDEARLAEALGVAVAAPAVTQSLVSALLAANAAGVTSLLVSEDIEAGDARERYEAIKAMGFQGLVVNSVENGAIAAAFFT